MYDSQRKDSVVLYHPALVPEGEVGQVRFPPLGLLAISAPLLEKGFNVSIIDSNIGDKPKFDQLDLNRVVCVGISAMTGHQLKDGLIFAKNIRELNDKIPIVWGGVHVSLMPEQSINSKLVDIIVSGQGEETFLDLVIALSNSRDIYGIKGLWLKSNGAALSTGNREFVSLDRFPPAAYQLLDIPRYLNETKEKLLRSSDAFLGGEQRFIYYCSSMGCPYRCRFCASTIHSKQKWSGLPAERVVKDVGSLIDKYNINSLQFCDAEFFISKKRAKDIAHGFIASGYDIKWKAQVRADQFKRFDESMLELLKRSGYTHVEIGAESGSQKMLDYIGKDISVDDILVCVEKIKKYGFLSSFCFVFGFPGETNADVKASFRLASKIKESLPNALLPIYFFDPYPGVPLYYESINMGMKAPSSMEEWADIRPNMREPSPLIPWMDKRYMRSIHSVFIFYLPLAFPADIGLGTLTYIKTRLARSPYRYLLLAAHKMALFRVRRQWFFFPFEWYIFLFFRGILKRMSFGADPRY